MFRREFEVRSKAYFYNYGTREKNTDKRANSIADITKTLGNIIEDSKPVLKKPALYPRARRARGPKIKISRGRGGRGGQKFKFTAGAGGRGG